jgi:hypothetical protein
MTSRLAWRAALAVLALATSGLAGYATGAGGFRADYQGDFHLENSRLAFTVDARASQIEILRFFGFGDETPSPERDEFFEVNQTQLSFAKQPTTVTTWSSRGTGTPSRSTTEAIPACSTGRIR